jgi:preprotein translocase subunit YajC
MKALDGLYIAPASKHTNPAATMNLPTGLTLRPEYRTQHPDEKESPAGSKAVPESTGTPGSTPPVKSPGGSQTAAPQSPCGMDTIVLIVPLVLVFYFFLLRPQQKQEKQLKQMRSTLKKGDRVVTSSGMHAIVTGVESSIVTVKPSLDGPSMRFDSGSIGRVITDEEEAGGTGGKTS